MAKELDAILGRIAALQRQLDRISITGGRDVIVEGEARRGFRIDIKDDEGGLLGAGTGQILGCTDPSASNYNPAATIDDGSCIYPHPPGVCPDVTLLCEQISSSLCKCGFLDFVNGTKHYLNSALTCDELGVSTGDCTAPGAHDCRAGVYDTLTSHGVASASAHYDEHCARIDDGGSFTATQTVVNCSGDTHNCNTSSSGVEHYDTFFCFSSSSIYTESSSVTEDSETITRTYPDGTVITFTNNLSNEYTTELLKSNTVDALPDYTDVFGSHLCQASTNLATDESCYAISRFKYKFTFSSAPAGMRISWKEHTHFDTGTSFDTPISWTASGGETESPVFEALEPTSNGTVVISDINCTAP